MPEKSSDSLSLPKKARLSHNARLIDTIVLWHIAVASLAALATDATALWRHSPTFSTSLTAQFTLYLLFACDILALAVVGRFIRARRGRPGLPVGKQALALLGVGVVNAVPAIAAGIAGEHIVSCFAAWVKIILIAGTISWETLFTLEHKNSFAAPLGGLEPAPLDAPGVIVRGPRLVQIVCWMTLFVFEVEALLLVGFASLFHKGVGGLIATLVFQTMGTGAMISYLFERDFYLKAGFNIAFMVFAGLASGPAYRWAKENPGVGFGLLPATLAWADCVLLFLSMAYDVYRGLQKVFVPLRTDALGPPRLER